jgi:GT2 family glycosyltransferase
LFKNAPINIYGPTSIFSKKIFDEIGGFDESLHYGMDTDLWLRFKNKGYKFKRLHSYFWGFRIHKDSKTSHAFEEKQSHAFLKESNAIRLKNNVSYTKKGILLQKVYKLLDGSYLKSFFDTKKLKFKDVLKINL